MKRVFYILVFLTISPFYINAQELDLNLLIKFTKCSNSQIEDIIHYHGGWSNTMKGENGSYFWTAKGRDNLFYIITRLKLNDVKKGSKISLTTNNNDVIFDIDTHMTAFDFKKINQDRENFESGFTLTENFENATYYIRLIKMVNAYGALTMTTIVQKK